MTRTTTIGLYVVLTGLLLAGCKSSTADGATAAAGATPAAAAPSTAPAGGGGGGGRPTACGLVTEQDASTALGSPAGPGTPGGNAATSECLFDDSALIVAMVTPGKAKYEAARAKLPANGFVDVPDVGDGAFVTGHGSNAGLQFYKGDTLVSILLNTSNQSATDSVVALAKIAAAHL